MLSFSLHALIKTRDVDNDALMRSATDRLLLVMRFGREHERAAIDADQFAACPNAHPDGRRGEMAYVEMDPEALVPARQQMLHGRERRRLDQVDHHRSGQDGNAPAPDMRRSVLSADQQVDGASQAGSQIRQLDHSAPWFKRGVSAFGIRQGECELAVVQNGKKAFFALTKAQAGRKDI